MLMANKVVVLAIFKDEAAADAAAQSVKDSGLAHDDAIGVLVLNHKGEIKAEKVGKRSTGKGAGIGLALALFTPVGLAAGIIGGGVLGALHHKGLGLDKADRDRIAAELGDGKAAVGVLAPADEAVAVMAGLTALGGAAESHEVADEDLEEAHAAAATDRLLADARRDGCSNWLGATTWGVSAVPGQRGRLAPAHAAVSSTAYEGV